MNIRVGSGSGFKYGNTYGYVPGPAPGEISHFRFFLQVLLTTFEVPEGSLDRLAVAGSTGVPESLYMSHVRSNKQFSIILYFFWSRIRPILTAPVSDKMLQRLRAKCAGSGGSGSGSASLGTMLTTPDRCSDCTTSGREGRM